MTPPGAITRTVIVPPPNGGAYYGAFLGEDKRNKEAEIKQSTIKAEEQKCGEKLDIVINFWSVPTLRGQFPTRAAEEAYQTGSALFIKEMPGEWGNHSPRLLPKIIQQVKAKKGKYYDYYVAFAKGIVTWGVGTASGGSDKPIFLSLGHEMNFSKDASYSYSWAGVPAEYKEYFALVHDLILENGATNVTFVFNPNVGEELSTSYFPDGCKIGSCVDWVGFDKYQKVEWGSWKSSSQLFGSEVERYRSLGLPMMIAEYGRNRSDVQAGESEVTISGTIEHVTQPGNIDGLDAFLYFDIDKDDGDWRLSGNNLSDFRSGMTARKSFFSSGIVTKRIGVESHPLTPIPTIEAKRPLSPSVPLTIKGSSSQFGMQTAKQFVNKSVAKLKAASARTRKLRSDVKDCKRADKAGVGCPKPLEEYYFDLGENLASIWLNGRNIGVENKKVLLEALNDGKKLNNFWKALLAIIIFQDQDLAGVYLPKMGIKTKYVPESDVSKLDILQEIYDKYLKTDSADLKLKAEVLIEKALLLWGLGKKAEAVETVEGVRKIVDFLLDEKNTEEVKANIRIHNHMGADAIQSEYDKYVAKARVFSVKLTLLEVENMQNQKEIIESLEHAYQQVIIASAGLDGMETVETYKLGAEILLRLGYFRKDQGNIEEYNACMKEAGILLGKVIAWGKEYTAALKEKIPHPWMGMLSADAEFLRLKMPIPGEELYWPEEKSGE